MRTALALLAFSVSQGALETPAGLVPVAKTAEGGVLNCDAPATIWQRIARRPGLQSCYSLDQARASLRSRPDHALLLAQRVLAAYPDSEHARLLSAHAHALLGDFATAHAFFLSIENRTDSAVRAPSFVPIAHLWVAAQVAVLVGELPVARERYRRLLLSLSRLSSPGETGRILIEAAVVALFVDGDAIQVQSYVRRAAEEHAALLQPWITSLRLTMATPTQATQLGADAALYWKMVELGVEEGENIRPGTSGLILPQGARAWLLAHLASRLLPTEMQGHLIELKCQVPRFPAHLLAAFGEFTARLTCPVSTDLSNEDELH